MRFLQGTFDLITMGCTLGPVLLKLPTDDSVGDFILGFWTQHLTLVGGEGLGLGEGEGDGSSKGGRGRMIWARG